MEKMTTCKKNANNWILEDYCAALAHDF